MLAQAQALREEVQREEATRERTLPISTRNAMSSQDAMRARRAEEQAAEAEAEAEVEEAAPSPVPGEDPVVAKARAQLAAAKAALEAAKREAVPIPGGGEGGGRRESELTNGWLVGCLFWFPFEPP